MSPVKLYSTCGPGTPRLPRCRPCAPITKWASTPSTRERRPWRTVAQWGTVVRHEFGTRSQYAYPLELITCPGGPVIQPLADAYGIPWRVEKELQCELGRLSRSAWSSRWNSPLVYGGISYSTTTLGLIDPQTWKSSPRDVIKVQVQAYPPSSILWEPLSREHGE